MSFSGDKINTHITVFKSLTQAILKLSGSDRIRYLHGRVTNNIKALQIGHSLESLVLTPQGKIQGKFVVNNFQDFLLLVSDPLENKEQVDSFISAIMQFKVADDVIAENISHTHCCIKAVGEKAFTFFNQLNNPQMLKSSFHLGKFPTLNLILENERANELIEKLKDEDIIKLTTEEFQHLRIKEAIPLMHQDISEKILGPEIDVEKYVSFTKGCYTGQEVVEMSTARGRPNKKLVLLQAESNNKIKVDSPIFHATQPEKPCGTITSATTDDKNSYYLGFLKTDFLEKNNFLAEDITLEIVK